MHVEGAKCRRECDLSRSGATLCEDRACRAREMQVRVRFGLVALHFWRKSRTKRSFWRLGASLLEEVSYANCRRERDLSCAWATLWEIVCVDGEQCRPRVSQKSVPERVFHESILTCSHLHMCLSTSTQLRIYITPAHLHCHSFTSALSFFLSTHLFASYFNLQPEVMGLGPVDVNCRLTWNCLSITSLARSRGLFTVFCGAIEEFELRNKLLVRVAYLGRASE